MSTHKAEPTIADMQVVIDELRAEVERLKRRIPMSQLKVEPDGTLFGFNWYASRHEIVHMKRDPFFQAIFVDQVSDFYKRSLDERVTEILIGLSDTPEEGS